MTITELYEKVLEGLLLAGGYFLDPNKRIFFGFLITSLILAFWVYHSKSNRKESFIHYVFNPKVWWSESAKIDYAFLIFNGIFKVLIIAPFLVFSLYLSFYIKEFLLNRFGYMDVIIPNVWIVVGYTLSLFICRDFSTYVVHYLFHKVPFLWRFHKVHHSATVLNPLTQYRIHPLELVINNLKGLLVFGLVTGLFDYLSNGQFNVFEILGVNVIGFLFMALGANLRHSHVKLKYPDWLESFLISPVQHQIHHSENKAHFDSNLGSVLAVWDNVFGTLIKSKNVKKLRFGLGEIENKRFQKFWQNLFPRN